MKIRMRKRKQGFAWVMDYYIDGQRHVETLHGIKGKREAQDIADQLWAKLKHGDLAPGRRAEKAVRLGHLLEAYAKDRAAHCVPRWIDGIRQMSRHLVEFFGADEPFISINEGRITEYRDRRLTQGAAVESVNKELSVLSGTGRMAVERRMISELPWRKIHRSVDRDPQEKWRWLRDEEIARLISVVKDGIEIQRKCRDGRTMRIPIQFDLRLYRQIVFLLNTGARRDEMFRLKWSDTDVGQRVVRLVSRKSARIGGGSAKERKIPMNDALISMFATMNRGAPEALVFGQDGNLHRKFKRAAELAGLGTKIKVHDLRHTFASHLVRAGVPLYTVMELLGHSSIKTTQRYAHIASENLEAAVGVLNFGAESAGAEIVSIG